jgi:Zn-dependent peptidase ImmA (M78 family)
MIKIKRTHIPLRSDEIRLLAEDLRQKLDCRDIEKVAQKEKIILHRSPGPAKRGGFSYGVVEEDIEGVLRPMLAIVINTDHRTPAGERVPESEIFWHEYYHLFYSPSANDWLIDASHYSLEQAGHAQEERRAQEFAAWLLVPDIHAGESPYELAERCNVSSRLANLAIARAGSHSTRTAVE